VKGQQNYICLHHKSAQHLIIIYCTIWNVLILWNKFYEQTFGNIWEIKQTNMPMKELYLMSLILPLPPQKIL
jgi:hypothetical protein